MVCKKNVMQANPDKFHVMLFSPTPTEQKVLQLRDGTSLMSETEVTVLGVTIDDRLCFLQHISVCYKKAAKQLIALTFISKHLNINSHMAIYNSFIMRRFNYCPLLWHFCGQVNIFFCVQIRNFICFIYRVTLLYPCLHVHGFTALCYFSYACGYSL